MATTRNDRHTATWTLSGFALGLLSRAFASAVVAAVITLTPFLWQPFEVVAALISARFEFDNQRGHPMADVYQHVAIVKLSPARYSGAEQAAEARAGKAPPPANVYDGRSPLNRCALADDLERMFRSPALRVVALDFDVGPYRSEATRGEIDCQKRLGEVLDGFAESKVGGVRRKLIILKSMSDTTRDPALAHAVGQWAIDREAKGITFARFELSKEYGIVRSFVPSTERGDALGIAFGKAIDATLGTKAGLDPPYHSQDAHPTTSRLLAVRGTEVFAYQGREAYLPALHSTWQADIDPPHPEIRAAIVGSGYSDDDRHLTVAGLRDGVDLHAAATACPGHPPSHFSHFAIDVIVGVALGLIFGWFWDRYYETTDGRRAERHEAWSHRRQKRWWVRLGWWATPWRPEAAWGWLVGMIGSAVVVTFVLAFASLMLIGGPCATAIFPAGMVVGMLVDAAVVQGPERAAHQMAHAAHEHAAHAHGEHVPAPAVPGTRAEWHARVRLVLGCLLILVALFPPWH